MTDRHARPSTSLRLGALCAAAGRAHAARRGVTMTEHLAALIWQDYRDLPLEGEVQLPDGTRAAWQYLPAHGLLLDHSGEDLDPGALAHALGVVSARRVRGMSGASLWAVTLPV